MRSTSIWMSGLLIGSLLGASSCAKLFTSKEIQLSSSCSVSTDQLESFMPKADSFPIKMKVDSNFTIQERESISRAVDSWNQQGRSLMGTPFFELIFSDLPTEYRSMDPHDCGLSFGSKNEFSLLRETNLGRWIDLGLTKQTPGVTMRCSSGIDLKQQMVLLYIPSIYPAQLQSVVTHELGHSLGLDHSCDKTQSNPNFTSCVGITENHPYHVAVMYPSLKSPGYSATSVELKETLMSNDRVRSNCLYGK